MATDIRKALEAMVKGHGSSDVRVFESWPGNLRATVVSDFFKDMGLSDRQENVWAYLKKHVSAAHLSRLYVVRPYDTKEFAALSPADSTSRPSVQTWRPRGQANDREAQ